MRPMTQALRQRDPPPLSTPVAAIKHFENPERVSLEDELGENDKTLKSKDASRWEEAIAAVPCYVWTVMLRSIVNYDWKGREGVWKEKKRQIVQNVAMGSAKLVKVSAWITRKYAGKRWYVVPYRCCQFFVFVAQVYAFHVTIPKVVVAGYAGDMCELVPQ